MRDNFLFSPDFSHFIDFRHDQFWIINTKTSKEEVPIPKDLIKLDDSINSIEAAQITAKRMHFSRKDLIEFVTEDGLWIMLKIFYLEDLIRDFELTPMHCLKKAPKISKI